MCGKDLEAWLDNELPPPTTPTISQSLNATAFATGDRLSMGITVNNTVSSTNFYVGGILPDGNTMFFLIALNPIILTEGFLDDPSSFRPLSKLSEVVPVGEKAHIPNVLTYTFIGMEPIGKYHIFSALSMPGVFADGSIDEGDIIMLDIDTATLSDGSCCD